MEQRWDWEKAAREYEWLVPWRYARGHDLWYQGGYSNTALNLLDRHLESRADDSSLIDRRHSRPVRRRYRDLYWDSARLARWWEKRGLGLGHRVLLYGAADVHLMTAMLALARVGATVVRSLETTDTMLIDRVLSTESHWAVATSDAARQVVYLRPRLGEHFRVLCADPMAGAASLESAMEEAEGLLDPVPAEANHIGAVVWGDDPNPYAYAGMGSIIGWHQSLKRLLALEPTDRVGVMSHSGGLLDPLWLTAALMAEGCPVVWLSDDARAGVREHGLTKLVAGAGYHPHLPELSGRLDRMVILGEQRPAGHWTSQRAEVVYARADMSAGVYRVGDAGGPLEAPSADRSRVPRSSAEVEAIPQYDSRDREILASVLGLQGVEDAVILPGTGLERHLWVATRQPAAEIQAQMGQDADELQVHTVSVLPATVEGRLAYRVLQAVQNQESHLSVGSLARPLLVEELVRAVHRPAR